MQSKSTQAVPNKRRGLRKLECPACPAGVYATWSQLERFGLPRCSCGEAFEPVDVEVAYGLGLSTPLVEEYAERVQRSIKSQAPHEARKHKLSDRYSAIAAEFEVARRVQAAEARLSALVPSRLNVDPMPF